jgi:heme-degrading monooxygenase HmoA
MHSRVVQFEVAPDRLDDALLFVKDEVVPRLQEAGGFKGISTLVDRSTGKAMSISHWETAEDVERSGELSTQLRDMTAEALGATFLSVEEFEMGQRLDAAGKATLHLQH